MMTVGEHLRKVTNPFQDAKTLGDVIDRLSRTMDSTIEIWSETACKGYFILAAQMARLDQKTIEIILAEMDDIVDMTSVEEAENAYRDFEKLPNPFISNGQVSATDRQW